MSQRSEATTVNVAQESAATAQPERWRLVAPAPASDLPDAASKSGRQAGLIIILASGAAFWGAVAGAIALLS